MITVFSDRMAAFMSKDGGYDYYGEHLFATIEDAIDKANQNRQPFHTNRVYVDRVEVYRTLPFNRCCRGKMGIFLVQP